jgi:hypothetical protein
MSRAGILLLVLVVAGFAALVLAPRSGRAPDVPFTASRVNLYTYTDAGDLAWEVRAREGESTGEEGTLLDVEVRFVSSDETSLTATAERLVRGDVESVLAGSVRVERGDGLRLETEELTWNEPAERLSAGPVTISLRNATLAGGTFEYDLRNDRTTVRDGVLVTLEEGEVSVRAEEAQELDGETFRLGGGIEAAFPEGTLLADRAEVSEETFTAVDSVSLRFDLASREAPNGS